jgi:H+-translocating NAD(P) transhydrogenase subunit alpha
MEVDMIIGIPKEIMLNEKRVAAIPDTAAKFIKLGFDVVVEASAGEGVFQSNEEYEKAGATIAPDAETVFSEADIILKVKEPTLNEALNKHEMQYLKENSTLITFLHPASPGNHDMVRELRDKNITAFTMDGIPRISRAQRMDALTSMSTVTGYKAVLIAANHMPKFIPMMGTSIGMVKPAGFLIIGAGVVGLQAIATAKRLGGVIKTVDIRDAARSEAASLGSKIAGYEVPDQLALGEGGYAKSLPEETLREEREALRPLVREADVIVLSALVPGEVAPTLITEDMVRTMKPGSVIIDVSVDQGGNCELTNPGREEHRHGVLISGIKNIPGSLPVHSTWLYANNMYYYVENLFKKGPGDFDMEDEIVRHSLVTHKGEIFHAGALKAMKEQ